MNMPTGAPIVHQEPPIRSARRVWTNLVHRAAGRFVMGTDTFDVGMVEGFVSAGGGQMVMTGTVMDNDRPEPVRHTITLSGDTLRMLKETRSPWQFRNEYRLVRATAP